MNVFISISNSSPKNIYFAKLSVDLRIFMGGGIMERNIKIVVMICLLILSSEVETFSEPIKVGVAGPLTGPIDQYGISIQRATETAAERYNANGGINGELISVVPADDLCNPSQAVIAANTLVSEGVAAVVGHICSSATQAALDVYKSENIIAISPASTNPSLTQSSIYPNFLRTVSPDDIQAFLQVKYILEALQLTNIALVHDGGAFGISMAGYANDFILQSAQGAVVLNGSITPGLNDYSAIVQDIIDSEAHILLYAGYEPEASKILNEMRLQNLQIPFFSCDAVKTDGFISNAGANAEGAYVTSSPDISINMIAQFATETYFSQYGEAPGPYFYHAYSAAICLIEAIDRTDSTNMTLLLDTLKNQSFPTPIGTTRFDEKGDVIGLGYSVYQVQNGQYVEVFGAVDAFAGNFDNDDDVDGLDWAKFTTNYGHINCADLPLCDGDFDNDGDVDEADLVVFSVYFGRANGHI